MDRQDQRGVLGDHQRLGGDLHALLAHGRDLFHQVPGVQHDTIADHRQLAATHHARGQRVQLVDLAVDHKGVAGVVPPLESDDHIGALRQPVDDLAFSFVTPLGSDNNDIGHGTSSGSGPNGVLLAKATGGRNPIFAPPSLWFFQISSGVGANALAFDPFGGRAPRAPLPQARPGSAGHRGSIRPKFQRWTE